MPQFPVSKVINGTTYELRAMDPLLVFDHGSKLVAEIAGPVTDKLALGGSVEFTKAAFVQVGVGAIGEILKRLSAPAVRAAVLDLFKYATANNVELEATWKVHFLGKTKDLVAFLAFALEVQFGDFFVGLGEQVAGALKERFALLASATAQKA